MATPASILNIGTAAGRNHFGVQIGRSGDATMLNVLPGAVQAGFAESPYFTPVAGGTAVQFWAPSDGPLSSSRAGGPRAELREYDRNGNQMGFDPFVGTHYLRGRTKITGLGTSQAGKGLIVAQLHNGSVDRVSIRTQFQTSNVRLRCRVNGTFTAPEWISVPGDTDGRLGILGTEFEWMIKVVNGQLTVFFNDLANPVITSSALTPTRGSTWYFKTGAYDQFDGATDPDQHGSVELRDLKHWHTGWP
ncbi:MAG TPA: polysaccharide lyase family 7 protein [Pseudonocardia sp.]|nr:polysaccharide lyase family 7 protein [Pseudonocardia sp.]